MPQIGPTQPWPRTQRMPAAVVGAHIQPWHYLAVAEYDAARGELTEMHRTASGQHIYTAAQVNQAIGWWNARAEAVEENEAPMRRHAEEAAEKIRARVAEDQACAEAARDAHKGYYATVGDAQWRASEGGDGVYTEPHGIVVAVGPFGHFKDEVAGYVARHDPAQVLARSATILDVLADLEKIADSDHPDPRGWARLAICELARMWELDEDGES